MGSPPRVRGKGGGVARSAAAGGITPACAGKRATAREAPWSCEDHPRVCGEKLSFFLRRELQKGSPPRVRGKDNPDYDMTQRERITPACAGKRQTQTDTAVRLWDHPRVCGEKEHFF